MKQIDFIQLPYLYRTESSAVPKARPMPTPIFTVSSRILKAGLDINFHDENIRPYRYGGADVILINLHGSPYIPEIIALEKRILKEASSRGKDVTFVLGGEIASRLTKEQFSRLFSKNTVNGNNDDVLGKAIGLDAAELPGAEEVSIIPMYEKLTDEEIVPYISQNISLFIAQGCKFSCKFCSAKRTRKDPETGIVLKQKESYKNISLIEDELDYLITRAKKLGFKKLIFYLSNLDLFQTPHTLGEFAKCTLRIRAKHPDFTIDLRGLATVDSFIKIEQNHPEVVEDLVNSGLNRVAFGIDGITPDVWEKIGKSHNFSRYDKNSLDIKARSAIGIAKDYGITTELLMLFGHNGADTEGSMEYAIKFTEEMLDKHSIIPRSFIAKDTVPGTEAWYDPANKNTVDMLIENPVLFQALDYLAIASPITHPDEEFRNLANRYFIKNATIGSMTRGDKPLYSTCLKPDGTGFEKFYGGLYDDLKRLNPDEIL